MAHVPVPTRLGRYRLIHPIGRGAHGTVYKAVQAGPGELERTVALKVLTAGAAGLWHEARLGGLLRHPHLVDVYEVGEADGHAFCAMEWCEGGALTGWAPLPPQAVVDAGLQACAALGYAHAQLGIVHLDIKPDNLFLARDGVKVGDWGVARAQGAGPAASGTLGFMPPEQRSGGEVDTTADVFALGMTLARLALGDTAALTFVPHSGALPTLDLGGEVTSDDEASVEVPQWLRQVVLRCLQPDPADRWPSMEALAEALSRLEVEGQGLRELLQQGSPLTPSPTPSEHEVPLFGRDEVLDELDAKLAQEGAVVMLKGAPGVGKSQVARAVAHRCATRGTRVVWCDVSGVQHLYDAMKQLARELHAPLAGDDLHSLLPRLKRVLEALGDTLVVFDDAGSSLEDPEALAAWDPPPTVRWLVTSRHPLHLPDEVVVDLPPLALGACHDVFWAAAQRRGVPPSTHSGLDALFERLDRLPLAIELAAGRLGVLALDDIVSNTELGFLRSARPGRHATLHTALQLSWELLSTTMRRALQALAAFHGRIAMEAIDHVLAPLGDPLELLEALAEHSLIRPEGNRFAVFATVRDYVAEVGPHRDWAEQAHAAYFASFGDAAGRAALVSHGGQRRWELLAASIDDVDLACERAVARRDGPTAIACLRAWWAVGALRGPFARGAELADRVLSTEGLSAADAAAATMVRGNAQRLTGQLHAAEASLLAALATADRDDLPELGLEAAVTMAGVYASLSRPADAHRVLGYWVARADGAVPPGLLAVGLAQWGSLPGHPGDLRTERLSRAAALARTSGHRRPEGMAVQVLAALDHMGHRRERAERRYRSALRVFEEIGDRRFGVIVGTNLAMLLMVHGKHDEATAILDRALRVCLEMGDRRQEIVVRIAIGDLFVHQGDGAAAVPTLQTAHTQALAVGMAQRAAVASLTLGRAWSLLGDAERAHAAIDEALRHYPIEEAELLTVRGHVALSLGDRATAETLLAQSRLVAADHHLEPIAELAERLAGR